MRRKILVVLHRETFRRHLQAALTVLMHGKEDEESGLHGIFAADFAGVSIDGLDALGEFFRRVHIG